MNRLLLLALLTACGGSASSTSPSAAPAPGAAAPAPAAPGTRSLTTQSGKYTVDVAFDPATPPLGQLFAVTAVVRGRDGAPMEKGVVKLDARMPQHGHGMETDPVADPGACAGDDCTHPGGHYRSEGFKFHMPGAWTVTVDVTGPEGPDATSFVVEAR